MVENCSGRTQPIIPLLKGRQPKSPRSSSIHGLGLAPNKTILEKVLVDVSSSKGHFLQLMSFKSA